MIPLATLSRLPWRWIALGGAFAILVLTSLYWKHRYEKTQAQLVQATVNIMQCADANDANVKTIAKQDEALKKWKEFGMVAAATLDQSKRAVEANKQDLETLRRENRRLRQQDQTPECIAVLRTDVTASCPSIDLGLRHLAEGCQKGGGSGDPCTDTEAFATGADTGLRTTVPVPGG